MGTSKIVAAAARALVIGSLGGKGGALRTSCSAAVWAVDRLSRTNPQSQLKIDITTEASVAACAASLSLNALYESIIVATGLLHDGQVSPEKTYRNMSIHALAKYFAVNAIGPAVVAKQLEPLLSTAARSVFAVLSARVGSTSDNGLGGWYGYRASKAALNSLIRTLAMELARTRPNAICVALHPGRVDARAQKAREDAVLLVDGTFLQRRELTSAWDFVIFRMFRKAKLGVGVTIATPSCLGNKRTRRTRFETLRPRILAAGVGVQSGRSN